MIYLIAFGNPVRGDDAFAWKVAEQLEPALPPNVTLLTLYQLSPELSEEISAAEAVIFVDARRGETPGEILVEEVKDSSIAAAFTHTLTPAMLLAYARGLYGRAPQAFLVTSTGSEFDLTTELTPPVAQSIPRALDTIRTLLTKIAAPAGK
jgi:hydrogenase maturation protease